MNSDGKKEDIRNAMRDALKGMKDIFKETSRVKIQNTLFSFPRFRNANVVSIYVSKDDEVGTRGIFTSLWEGGKTVVLAPRIHGNTLEMCQVYSQKDFTEGPYRLKEPSAHISPYTGYIDVVITPGIAFDGDGIRLGRGKGFYDSFFQTTHGCAIGLAYDIQVMNKLPENDWDQRMAYVITEKRIIVGSKK
jgi:5-formyltetrahydrofolate cyclo-ligase